MWLTCGVAKGDWEPNGELGSAAGAVKLLNPEPEAGVEGVRVSLDRAESHDDDCCGAADDCDEGNIVSESLELEWWPSTLSMRPLSKSPLKNPDDVFCVVLEDPVLLPVSLAVVSPDQGFAHVGSVNKVVGAFVLPLLNWPDFFWASSGFSASPKICSGVGTLIIFAGVNALISVRTFIGS